MDIPHSSKVVTGRRVPLWQRPDWDEDRIWIGLAPLLILGALGWFAYQLEARDAAGGAIGILLAVLALAIGIGILYAYFIADRSVEAPCPVCGTRGRWTPGEHSSTCGTCMASMQVANDGTIREVSLDDNSGFLLLVDEETFGDSFDKNGHVTIVMPAICAACGAEPTTTGKVKNDTSMRPDDQVTTTTARDLAALAVPLCAQHAEQTPVSVDDFLANLYVDSYRYYRALVLANGIPKKHVAKAAKGAPRPRAIPGELEPLLCPSCGAPLAVGTGDDTTCASCGHTSPLPEPYKLMRDAKRMSEQDATELQSLAADIAKPSPPWKRVAMIVGYIVGGVTVVVMAIGAIIGAVLGVMAGGQLGDTVAKFLAIVGAIVFGVLSIPYAGEAVTSMVMLHSTSAAADIINSASPAYRYDLIAAAVLYGLGVLPLALAYRTQGNLTAITELQGKLAAHQSVDGGALCCRHCGAALELARDAVVARCLYCGADNLLTVLVETATTQRDEAKQLDASVRDAVAQHARERKEDGAATLALLGMGLLLVPFICLGGYLFHKLLG